MFPLLDDRVGGAADSAAMVRAVPSAVGVAKEGALTSSAIRGWAGGQLIFGWSAQRVGARDDDAKFISVFVAASELIVYQSGMFTSRSKSFRLRVFCGSNSRWWT